MNAHRLVLLFSVLGLVVGCPTPETPPAAGTNSVTLHNTGDHDIGEFCVTRMCDCPADTAKTGINVLPEPVKPGEEFTVDGLFDGKYELYAYDHGIHQQVLEGGQNYDWYCP